MLRRAGLLPWLLVLAIAPSPLRATSIQVEAVRGTGDLPGAVEPGALTRACAPTDGELREFFEERDAPFDPGLVRERDGLRCHVDYEPSLPGFRADPEDRSVRELFINVDGLHFLARREHVFGDALDISKAIVKRLPPGTTVTLGTRWESTPERYESALAFHYGDRGRRLEWRRSPVRGPANPWTQDYLKSGRVDGATRILVTRRLFEGRPEDGEVYRPMLDALTDRRFARSRLSWEGGDLQFVRHPRHPDRLVLLFGHSARGYWGEDLSQDEYAYVLRREFGADDSVDLGHLAPHVDYFVAFLPADRIALVSQTLTGSRELAFEAAVALEGRFSGSPPPATLSELRQRLGRPAALSAGREGVEEALARATEGAKAGWPRFEAPGLAERASRYIDAHCPQAPSACFEGESIDELLDTDPALLRDWATAARRNQTESLMDVRLLSLVKSQLRREGARDQDLVDRKVRELEELGFRIVRVPRLGGDDPSLEEPWSGISYVNSLLVDRMLFVPRFGLGAPEERILDDLERALPARYEVVPVPARHMLLSGGGVHCTVAIVRD